MKHCFFFKLFYEVDKKHGCQIKTKLSKLQKSIDKAYYVAFCSAQEMIANVLNHVYEFVMKAK